jgi:hypothetical protein
LGAPVIEQVASAPKQALKHGIIPDSSNTVAVQESEAEFVAPEPSGIE